MKIHLNRELLKNFFISATYLLRENGKVHVTLAQGQSGTPYDITQRRYTDSWQIIAMATYAELVLKKAHPFYPEDYPEYHCNGYRSLEKGFHLHGAWTFSFARAPSIKHFIPSANTHGFINELNLLHCPYVQNQLDEANDSMFEEMELFYQFLSIEDTNLKVCRSLQTLCFCEQDTNSDDQSKVIILEKHDPNYNFSSFLLCRSCSSERGQPVQRIVLINVPSTNERIQSLLHFFNRRCEQIEVKKHALFSTTDYKTCDGIIVATVLFKESCDNSSLLIAIDIEAFFQLKFNFPHPSIPFPVSCTDFGITSLYPPSFCHHLSFWIPNSFKHDQFACCLRYAGGKIVKTFRLINTYSCPTTGRISLCYAIIYQSFLSALNSETAFELQVNVIGPFLEKCLGIVIK